MLSAVAREASAGTESDQIFKKEEEKERERGNRAREGGREESNILWRFITYIVQFKVEAAGVTHRVPVGVSPPQRRRCRLTVCARRPRPPGCGLHAHRRRQEREKRSVTWPRNKKTNQHAGVLFCFFFFILEDVTPRFRALKKRIFLRVKVRFLPRFWSFILFENLILCVVLTALYAWHPPPKEKIYAI